MDTLAAVANARIHGTTGEIPNQRLLLEQNSLLPLPMYIGNVAHSGVHQALPMPIESLQHPLSMYDQLLGLSA